MLVTGDKNDYIFDNARGLNRVRIGGGHGCLLVLAVMFSVAAICVVAVHLHYPLELTRKLLFVVATLRVCKP